VKSTVYVAPDYAFPPTSYYYVRFEVSTAVTMMIIISQKMIIIILITTLRSKYSVRPTTLKYRNIYNSSLSKRPSPTHTEISSLDTQILSLHDL
jgi:hypothetical protein